MISYTSKLQESTSIFSVMSKLSAEYNAINLGQGFPNFDCDPILLERITYYLKDNKNQYAPSIGVEVLRSAIADKIRALYETEVNHDTEITITAGATQAIFSIINAFIKQKDEVIIIEPAYDSYKPSIELAGGVVIPYRLDAPDFKINWQAISELVSDRTRMIIVNTPHNPTGTVLSEVDMLALQTLVSGKNIIVLSDEVYEHLIYDDQRHESVLRYPELYNQSLAVYSFGKTFHATGWKIGYCVGPHYLMAEMRKHHQWNVFSVNSFIQYALADYLREAYSYNGLATFYQEKRDHFNAVINGTSLKPLASQGTYFQLFDYSEVSDKSDLEFAKDMVTEWGIASIPLSPFFSDGSEDKLVRFCFAKTEALLDQAGELLRRV